MITTFSVMTSPHFFILTSAALIARNLEHISFCCMHDQFTHHKYTNNDVRMKAGAQQKEIEKYVLVSDNFRFHGPRRVRENR